MLEIPLKYYAEGLEADSSECIGTCKGLARDLRCDRQSWDPGPVLPVQYHGLW